MITGNSNNLGLCGQILRNVSLLPSFPAGKTKKVTQPLCSLQPLLRCFVFLRPTKGSGWSFCETESAGRSPDDLPSLTSIDASFPNCDNSWDCPSPPARSYVRKYFSWPGLTGPEVTPQFKTGKKRKCRLLLLLLFLFSVYISRVRKSEGCQLFLSRRLFVPLPPCQQP